MKVLVVCSGNSGFVSPFVKEQVESLKQINIKIDLFQIKGKGILGYLINFISFQKKIESFSPNLIHAHYGFSGLFAALQQKVPVVTTFHGGDIYIKQNSIKNISLSWLASIFSKSNIFVNKRIPKLFRIRKYNVIPCGVDLDTFYPIDNYEAREKIALDVDKVYGLFSSRFDNSVKNYSLAKKAITRLNHKVKLIELKGYSRKEVNLLLNAVNFLIFTSISEGSPQLIKEAMSCNCPIVSVDVGDVKEVIGKTEGNFITSYHPHDIAENIEKVLNFGKRTNSNKRISQLKLDNRSIANLLIGVYQKVLR